MTPLIKAHKLPDRAPTHVPAPVLVHQRPCLSVRSSGSAARGGAGWRDPWGLFCTLTAWPRWARALPACDSVVCVCLASASLNKQWWWGWALLCGVFTVEPGCGCERVRRGRGPSSSTATPPASAGRAAGWKAPRAKQRGWEQMGTRSGGAASQSRQLLLAASSLEKGLPPPLRPRSPVSSPWKSGREMSWWK